MSRETAGITDVRTVLLTGPCTEDPFLSEARKRRSAAFIELRTNAGVTGVGETYAGYFIPEAVPPVVEFCKPILLGQSADDIPALWARMVHCGNFWCRTGLGLAIINGIEAALWDLKGKLLGKPVVELLGGVRHDRLPCYATGGPSNYPKDKLAAKIEFYRSLGFNAVKLGAGCHEQGRWKVPGDPAEAADFEADKLSWVCAQFGADLSVMLDGHMGNSPTTWRYETAAAVVRALEPFGLTFFEEPLHYNDAAGYAELCRLTRLPIAGGEVLIGEAEWRPFIETDAFDIGQLDAAYVGGLGQFVSLARDLERRGRRIATHSWGAGPCLMQNLHAAFACRNTAILEMPPSAGPLHRELIGDRLTMSDGCLLPPQAPGLGIELSETMISRFPFVPGSGEFNSVPGKQLVD